MNKETLHNLTEYIITTMTDNGFCQSASPHGVSDRAKELYAELTADDPEESETTAGRGGLSVVVSAEGWEPFILSRISLIVDEPTVKVLEVDCGITEPEVRFDARRGTFFVGLKDPSVEPRRTEIQIGGLDTGWRIATSTSRFTVTIFLYQRNEGVEMWSVPQRPVPGGLP